MCFCSCAQSGTGRHNSHQRKIHQQEESCQNLTDFTPARVPSKVDIFTAYNDSMQCSHECMRTAVPIYTDEMIQQTPVYKSSYNGNRWVPPRGTRSHGATLRCSVWLRRNYTSKACAIGNVTTRGSVYLMCSRDMMEPHSTQGWSG